MIIPQKTIFSVFSVVVSGMIYLAGISPTIAETPAADVVHQINFERVDSAILAEKYDFIREAMKPIKSFDGSEFEEPPAPFPEFVKIAEIAIPDKKLTFVALLVEGVGWCNNFGNCSLSYYFLQDDGSYAPLTAFYNSELSSYYITNPGSFSVVYCESGAFQRWEMKDGALAGPMPMDQPGYFAYKGVYNHPDMKNSCPER